MALTNRGIGYGVTVDVGIDVVPRPFARNFELTRCPPEFLSRNATLTCGMMAVTESRGEPGSPKIRFPVAIAKHPSRPAHLKPLLLLGGGPGDALFPSLPTLLVDADASAALLGGQNLIAVEYRGGGAATPRLTCDTALLNDAAAIAACIAKFAQLGVNLRRYNSVEIATD